METIQWLANLHLMPFLEFIVASMTMTLLFSVMLRLHRSANHGVIPHGLDDLKVGKIVDTCQRCIYCHRHLQSSVEACAGCGAPNPCYAPLKGKDRADVEFSREVRELTQAMAFGEDDCDVDELRGDNNAVLVRISRCRERVGPLPPPGPSSKIYR